ncbi:hypothetical protein CUJ84_Chr001693 [Rhizobium leguminosarum]|uniref:Uncharacterized protein n=1 Tax=Rhizobium leguminosarum TaxID=384 RepID=A0A2K9Z1H8_RHILE|nr:hypothetical protein CUJ84_Chr001693 [Rhizobium leguminosarum]
MRALVAWLIGQSIERQCDCMDRPRGYPTKCYRLAALATGFLAGRRAARYSANILYGRWASSAYPEIAGSFH